MDKSFDKLIVGLSLFFQLTLVYGAPALPGDSARLLPKLDAEIKTYWPTLSPRAFPAGVIDQESNWKVKATLKTSRELGCGLGQFTIAYDAAGKPRFDALTETKQLNSNLKGWSWSDCYNEEYQIRGVITKLRINDRNCSALMENNLESKACAAAQYNGGAGSVNKRIRTCRMTPGCEPRIWFDNLQKQCPQSNVKVAGYGESFCDINSKYPTRVFTRMNKFERFLTPETKK